MQKRKQMRKTKKTTKPIIVKRRNYKNSTLVAGGKQLATAGRNAARGVAKLLTPVRKAASNVGGTALNTVANTFNIGEETTEFKLYKLNQAENRQLDKLNKIRKQRRNLVKK